MFKIGDKLAIPVSLTNIAAPYEFGASKPYPRIRNDVIHEGETVGSVEYDEYGRIVIVHQESKTIWLLKPGDIFTSLDALIRARKGGDDAV